MPARIGVLWDRIRDSLWFIPSVMAASAIALAWITVEIDKQLLADNRTEFYLAFGGGVEGARGVLTAIASTAITVTGVVFSITIVALQLASSQFTPRVLRNFAADRVNHVVLGVFIGAFIYALLVLRTVRSELEDGSSFVPSLSVGIAIILALVSIASLIFFIHHSARSIQVSTILERITKDTVGLVDSLFPDPFDERTESEREAALPTETPRIVTSSQAGYLQAVDNHALFELARRENLTVRMEPLVGEFVLPGAPLASVWSSGAVIGDQAIEGVRGTFVVGPQRTLHEDLELGLRQLTDIGVRALSPGTNDPTTATLCADRLAEVLVRLGNRAMPRPIRAEQAGSARVVAQTTTFDRAVDLGFDQLRHYGAKDPSVAVHLIETLGRVAELVPACRRAVLIRQARGVLRAGREAISDPWDLARVERASGWTSTHLDQAGRDAPAAA